MVSGWAEVCCLSDTDLIPNITIQVLPGVLPMPTGMAAKHTVENVLVLSKWTDMRLDNGILYKIIETNSDLE